MKNQSYTGLNIQFPISQEILAGRKTVETRTYPLPIRYVGQPLVIIETPGKQGNFKARIVAIVRFGPSFRYESSAAFQRDLKRHLVTSKSSWRWKSDSPKWGWPIEQLQLFDKPLPAPSNKGIKYTLGVKIPKAALRSFLS